MAFGIPVKDVIAWIGHDGSDIIFPDLREPMCRRGFHQQELVELALRHLIYPTPFQLLPATRSECGQLRYILYPSELNKAERFRLFDETIKKSYGVLEGRGTSCHHSVAYDHGVIFDPDGREYEYSVKNCEAQGFYGKQLWIFN